MTRVVTICAFSFVPCETLWTIRYRSSAPLSLSIIVCPVKDTGILPTPIFNEAPKGKEPRITAAGSHFKGVDMAKAMIMALLLRYVVMTVVHIVLCYIIVVPRLTCPDTWSWHNFNLAFLSSIYPCFFSSFFKTDQNARRK